MENLPGQLVSNVVTNEQARAVMSQLHLAETQWNIQTNQFYHARPSRNVPGEFEGFTYLVTDEMPVDSSLRYTELMQACEAD